jgi:hypothetical protein
MVVAPKTIAKQSFHAAMTIKAADYFRQTWSPEEMIAKIKSEIGITFKSNDCRLTVILKDMEQYRNGPNIEKVDALIKLLQLLNKPEILQMFQYFKSCGVDFNVEKADTAPAMREKVLSFYDIDADRIKNVLGSENNKLGGKGAAKKRLAVPKKRNNMKPSSFVELSRLHHHKN